MSRRLTVLTKADLLAYVRNELDGESRKVVDRAIASSARVRTMVANCGNADDVPPILVRQNGREIHVL